MREDPVGSLVLEPVQHSLQPASGQSASCCSHGLPNLINVFGGMGKVQDAYRIRTVVVHQPLQPLCSILHCAHLGCLFHPPPMRFHQRCLRKALGVRQPRTGGDLLDAHLPARVARDLSDRQRLDFDPLTSHQEYKGTIPTHRLLVRSSRRLGSLPLETLHLRLPPRQRCLPCRPWGCFLSSVWTLLFSRAPAKSGWWYRTIESRVVPLGISVGSIL